MKLRSVIKIRDGEARITSTKRYLEYLERRRSDPHDTALAALGGPCEQACKEHGGVAQCGHTWVECNDGSVFLIDP